MRARVSAEQDLSLLAGESFSSAKKKIPREIEKSLFILSLFVFKLQSDNALVSSTHENTQTRVIDETFRASVDKIPQDFQTDGGFRGIAPCGQFTGEFRRFRRVRMKRAQVAAVRRGERDRGEGCAREDAICRMGDREGKSEIPMTKQDESLV